MQFELTKEFLEELTSAVNAGNHNFVVAQISDLHPADVAEILDEVTLDQAKFIYNDLGEEKAADVLMELDEDTRERFLASLSAKEIAEHVDNMDSDDAADLIQELPEYRKDNVIAQLEDEEQASDIVSLLNYDENTAGGLMAKEYIKVNLSWTVGECLVKMREQAEEVSHVYTIYVVDDQEALIGTLSLKSFLFADDTTPIRSLFMDGHP